MKLEGNCGISKEFRRTDFGKRLSPECYPPIFSDAGS